jgi:hypothetical protein
VIEGETMSEHECLPSIEDLYAKAESLAGRPVEVDRLKNGQYVALWMRFDVPPPKSADSEVGALENFIRMMEEKGPDNLPDLGPEDIESMTV